MKQNTETMLCAALMELLKKQPFSKITIQKIATQCGVNRQTFYYHYDNIYDLLYSAFEYKLIKESHLYEEESWQKAMEKFLLWMKKNRVIIMNIVNNVDTHYLRESIYPIVLKTMSNGYRPNVIIKQDNEKEDLFLHKFLMFGITQYVLEWTEGGFREPVGEVIDNTFLVLKRIYGETV